MRKRRRLADKLTIMVCAVLVAVSAFFYAPMKVSASSASIVYSDIVYLDEQLSGEEFYSLYGSESLEYEGTFSFTNSSYRFGRLFRTIGTFDFSPYIDGSSDVYEVVADFNYNLSWNSADTGILSYASYGSSDYGQIGSARFTSIAYNADGYSYSVPSQKFYVNKDDLTYDFHLSGTFYTNRSSSGVDLDVLLNINVLSVSPLNNIQSDEYQNGYNAGFSDGETLGYGNGYSQGFADGEASVDTNEIYNQGFNAGKESVDTQSYYDAGYQSGYQVAYSEGYDSGYDEGYQSAMDRIDGWGADTNDYPLSVYSYPSTSRVFDVTVKTSYPVQYIDYSEWTFDYDFNPNHTYRFDVSVLPSEYKEGSADIYFLQEDIFFFNIGGIKYRISNYSGSNVNEFYVPGDRMSSAFGFSWEPILAVMGNTMESGTAYCYYNLSYSIYDMGPSGDTQNHIANQTDSLTNGFNDSQGNSVNNDFSSGLNHFETAEDSLFATATTGLKDFTFFDIQSVPAMVTGMSFVGSIMSGWFSQAGGASGVGIVLSILFSIMLVAMVLGLYRWYQSKGGKD